MNTIRLLRISFLLGLIGLGTLSYAAQLNPRQNPQMFDKELERALAASREEADLQKALVESKKLAERNTVATNDQENKALRAAIEQSEREFKEFEAKKKAATNVRKFKSLKELQTFYTQELQKEAADLERIFLELTCVSKELFDITEKYLHKTIEDVENERLNELLPIEGKYNPNDPFKASVILMIYNLQKSLGLKNNFRILFDEGSENVGYTAECSPKFIRIEVSACKSLSPAKLETTILHELNHIVFNDPFTRPTMDAILAKRNKQSQETFMQMLTFFQEKRADVLAWVRSKEHVVSAIKFYEELVQKGIKVDERVSVHPSNPNRLALARQIYAEMCALP